MTDAKERMNPQATDLSAVARSAKVEGAEGSESLLSLIAAFRRKRIVVFGDLIADEFVYGRIARVSRVAPVLIL